MLFFSFYSITNFYLFLLLDDCHNYIFILLAYFFLMENYRPLLHFHSQPVEISLASLVIYISVHLIRCRVDFRFVPFYVYQSIFYIFRYFVFAFLNIYNLLFNLFVTFSNADTFIWWYFGSTHFNRFFFVCLPILSISTFSSC